MPKEKGYTLQLDHQDVAITSPEKILFPQDGLTKSDVVEHYRRVAPRLLPHLHDRPISMQRFPNGIDEPGFYQKEVPGYFPDWIRRADVEVLAEGQTQQQVLVQDEPTLLYLVNQGTLIFHPWLSVTQDLNKPDRIVFDLDPTRPVFEPIREAAGLLREVCLELGLLPYLMTTGSRGLHITIPILPEVDFDFARDFARSLAEYLAARLPEKLTTEVRKGERNDRIFVDYLRNAYGQTSVATYSLRARPGAPVATPLAWDELKQPDLHSQKYTLTNLPRRLEQGKDPWANLEEDARSARAAMERLELLR